MTVYLLRLGFDHVVGVYSTEAIADSHVTAFVSLGYSPEHFDVGTFVVDAEPVL